MQVADGLKPPEFLLNGRAASIEGVSTQTTLLDYMRAHGLTGAKEACAEGECGACTVMMVGDARGLSEYRTVNSCLILAPMAAGQEIYTVESLARDGKLCDAQAAMAASGGSQCGYCTPGFVMSLFAEQYRRGRTAPCDWRELGGNLCRCTGYRPIRDAALSLGPAPEGPFLDRLAKSPPSIEAFEYLSNGARFSRPASLEECLRVIAADPEARLIAGGTDLVVESNLRMQRWAHLISTEAIAELRQFEANPEKIRIGAGLTLSEIARRWMEPPECFTQWIPWFASPPLRNRATLAGNLATASPIGDGAPMLLALDANIEIAGLEGRRSVPLSSFFKDYRRTSLAPGEIITAIEILKPLPSVTRFYKVAKRKLDDISTVAAGIAMDFDEGGRVVRARFAFGGVAAVPMRAIAAEQAVIGKRFDQASVDRVRAILERELKPISDHRGSAQYRVAVAASLIEKFWSERREAA